MVSFITLDLSLLALFIIGVIIFLYTRKHNLKREGIVYLYRTKLGIELIEKTSKKYQKILKPLQYLVIFSGYILMIIMIYLLVKTLFFYLQQSSTSAIAKVPAVFPLIPYFPQLFHLDSFFPPFYFTYFIIAIAIIAISHEFSHGIFARLNKIKIHSTGFAFLGPFLGAFVEQDEKQMNKAKKFPQLAILAAGTFANLVMALLFILLIAIFFAIAYSPAGFIFNSYAISAINVSDIDSVSNISLNGINFYSLNVSGQTYFAETSSFNYMLENNYSTAIVYDNAPAINAGLKGAIISINGIKILSQKDLSNTLNRSKPGDTVQIKTFYNNSIKEYSIKLGSRNGKAFLGIISNEPSSSGFSGIIFKVISIVKKPNIYYTSNIGAIADFIYDLLWWIIVINILVALFNMYPAGILDGGRFLLLTVWGITGNKRHGEIALKITTWFLLILIALMMVKWFFNII